MNAIKTLAIMPSYVISVLFIYFFSCYFISFDVIIFYIIGFVEKGGCY